MVTPTLSLGASGFDHAGMRLPHTFVWGYGTRLPGRALLDKAARIGRWEAASDLDWSLEIDPGVLPESDWSLFMELTDGGVLGGPLIEALGDDPEILREIVAQHHGWLISQVLHSEQAALVAAAEICAAATSIEDKLMTAALVADEARHVEAYQRYLSKIGISYPVSPPLHELLSHVVNLRYADMSYLGTQVLLEGVAGAITSMGGALLPNPLIRQVNTLVRRDEARHIAYGVLSLQGLYEEMSARERREREDFVIDASLLLCRLLQPIQVWEHFGIDTSRAPAQFAESCDALVFRSLVFSQVVPALHKLGLLTERVQDALDVMGAWPLDCHMDLTPVSPTEPASLLSPPSLPAEIESDPFLALRAMLGALELIAPEPVLCVLAELADPSHVAAAAPARIRLQVAGFDDGDWLLTMNDTEMSYRRFGTPGEPEEMASGAGDIDVQVTLDAATWTEVVSGRLGVAAALVDRRVTVTGDSSKAYALAALF